MWGWVVVLALGALAAAAPSAHAGEPRVTARAAIVMDAATGEVVWSQNADLELPPASTTKVVTAIVALESHRLGDSFRVSSRAASTAPTKLGLHAGDRMTLGDLLYAVLLKSANDAAVVVAEGLGGSEERFAARMNAKAREIGATSSTFVNPHGLTAAGHLSTVRDLATIFRYGLRNREFREILETPRIRVPVDSPRLDTVTVRSHNRLLTGWDAHQVIGKTGYTRAAGRCFVGSAASGGREIVIALLGSRDLWGDAQRLVAHGFGERADEPAPVVASRTRTSTAARSRKGNGRKGSRPVVVTAEGDDDIPTRFRRSGVHVASVSRKATAGDRATSYTVRLGPYPSRKEAQAAQTRLARAGHQGRVVGQAIMLGERSTRERADKLAGTLKRKGYRPTIVGAR
jgi:D-alanyl-D-alanine carboxypeptidase (penicillin-binding protein 5/6)